MHIDAYAGRGFKRDLFLAGSHTSRVRIPMQCGGDTVAGRNQNIAHSRDVSLFRQHINIAGSAHSQTLGEENAGPRPPEIELRGSADGSLSEEKTSKRAGRKRTAPRSQTE